MDLLADVLKHSGLKKRILNQRSFFSPTALRFPCDKSIGFHVITQGEAFIATDGKSKPLHLKKGDVALMARGCDHIVSTEEDLPKKISNMADHIEPAPSSVPSSKKQKLTLVSGAYQFWNTPVHPFFDELPEWFVLKSEEIESHDLQTTIRLIIDEVSQSNFGSEVIVQALLDISFAQIVRKIMLQRQSRPETWSHALQNNQIKAALEMMHADCAKDWTLDELAKRVGLSRAGFAQKFKSTLGDTPLHYLTTVRMQKAMDLLSQTSDKIEVVAEAVGYKDAFSFSKVFKKVTGLPPKEFRKKDLEEKNLKWRF